MTGGGGGGGGNLLKIFFGRKILRGRRLNLRVW